ncbi:MAG: proline--tRNA ligase, partial [Holosporaceae bacterium]|nr:proline--tRNA ligase [Holosporaceae bacterium]
LPICPRFGVMRGREFLMKDAYSFDIDFVGASRIYQQMFRAYIRTFRRIGLTPVPVQASSGAIGGNISHEFHILADTGESTLYYDRKLSSASDEELMNIFAASDEKYDPAIAPLPENELMISKGIEVGHIFYFGTKYSKSMNAFVLDANGNKIYPEMGSYGIGVSRLVAAIIESSHDEHGIIWPEPVAPFDVTILNLYPDDEKCREAAVRIYESIPADNALYDDRSISIGEKLADADLIGIPWQIIIGKKKISEELVELRNRKTRETKEMSSDEVIRRFNHKC